MNLIILASGNLGLKTLLTIDKKLIQYVFTDSGSTEIINWATGARVPVLAGNPRNTDNFDFLKSYSDVWIISINYLFIIPEAMINAVSGRALNIHGALLPKYRGRTPHVWAIINGEKQTGITVHYIAPEVDAGDIVFQSKIEIDHRMTGGGLLNQFDFWYPTIIEDIIDRIQDNALVRTPQDHSKATYFPKRTPDMGRINWSWQKDRIYNWVRAQTRPYPGAFTCYGKTKITIWKIEPCDDGFDGELKDGIILGVGPGDCFDVKCANSTMRITDFECSDKHILEMLIDTGACLT